MKRENVNVVHGIKIIMSLSLISRFPRESRDPLKQLQYQDWPLTTGGLRKYTLLQVAWS